MKIKNLQQYKKDWTGKKVFLRSDLNVPIKDGKIKDDYKLSRQMPTLRFLLKNQAKVILASHLGRPDPAVKEKKYSLAPIGKWLQAELGPKKVLFARDTTGFDAATKIGQMKNGQVVLLENVRYEAGEKEDDKRLARRYAKMADIFVNNAFAVSHRAEASVSAIQSLLPAYAGFLLANELMALSRIFDPKRPLVTILGGAKLKTKLPLIKRLLPLSDHVLLGGALANTLLKARGFEIGKSLWDADSLPQAAKLKSEKIILPIDVVVSKKENGWQARAVPVIKVQADDYIFDIGPQSIKFYSKHIKSAATLVWNGPLGMFEDEHYKHGTIAVARVLAARSTGAAYGVCGGGETVEALKLTKMMDHVDWVSTGGGAMLSFLSNQKMPGLKGIMAL